ncbi:MAG: 50S ribosomal protein L9 [Deltaproteobacteria bacterium]|nr:50S ribosomal protein L9 [Deltaproteobacteria bacterium]MBW1871115.1 50S ribosomal protein L9 [Deltaproteobacteria bacterium]
MKVILREDVPELGAVGELVSVKDGYARNYLIPKQLAVLANTKNIRQMDHQKRLIEANKVRVRKEAGDIAGQLETVSCTIPMLVGEQDKLFGSVTSKDIEEALQHEGITLSRKRIILDEPIKSLGVYTVDVRLHSEVTAKLKIWVVAK